MDAYEGEADHVYAVTLSGGLSGSYVVELVPMTDFILSGNEFRNLRIEGCSIIELYILHPDGKYRVKSIMEFVQSVARPGLVLSVLIFDQGS